MADALIVLTFLILVARQTRQVAFLLPAIASIVAGAIEQLPFYERLTRARTVRWIEARRYAPVVMVPAALLVLSIAAIPRWGSLEPDAPTARAIAALVAQHGIRGNVYAARPWAAYLWFRNLPVRILIDSHADPYDAGVWADEHTLNTLAPGFRDVLDRRRLDAVIVEDRSPLAQGMAFLPGWRFVGSHDGISAFKREHGSISSAPPPKPIPTAPASVH